MRNLIVLEYVSLDGVIQGPGYPDEDRAGGFEHGGWTGPFMSDHRRYVAESFNATDAFLLGRLTYEIFAAYWPTVTDAGDELAQALNTRPKYVVSTTLDEPRWEPTTVITTDVARQVARLKEEPGKGLLVIGSSKVAHTLMKHDLVDEYRLMVHPIVLGSGKQLFGEADPKSLRLVDTRATNSGLVILTYQAKAGE